MKKTTVFETASGSEARSKNGQFESASFQFSFEYKHSARLAELKADFPAGYYAESNAESFCIKLEEALQEFRLAIKRAQTEPEDTSRVA